MRSLSTKLVLAFLFVALAGLILIVVVTRWTTFNQFDDFIFNRGRESLIASLEEYYVTYGTWDGLDSVFPHMFQPQFAPQPMPRERAPFTLLDHQNVVVVAGRGFSPGQQTIKGNIKGSIPITVEGKVVGWVIIDNNAFRRGIADSAFLSQITTTLLLSALGAMLLALVLGVLLARTMTGPLRELTAATKAVAEGDLDQTVPVRSNDELGELADSFNMMSAELSHAQQLRRQMTADIAHELRTPISVILGHADAIEEGVLPPSSETLEIIRDEAGRLERIVDDLRLLSRADAGELTYDMQPTEVPPVLEQIERAHRHTASTSGVKITVSCEAGIPTVLMDRDRMSMVLNNLVNNAIRFSPEGSSISLSAHNEGDHVCIGVTDEGPGIPKEEQAHVFERFYRVDKSRHRDDGGSGLGLAIAKSIVDQHGGNITVESEIGKGTSFVVRLPSIK